MRTRATLAALLAVAGAARADLFSPGPLAKVHANLEGVANCTQCHVKGGRLSEQRCLDCHTELKDRVAKKQGFHGRIPPGQLSCNACHHEHQGRDFELVKWPAGGQKAFDHRKTGYPLEGAHAKLDCAQCHVKKFVVDAGVRALIAQQPARRTFLGLGTQCTQCHFDEHRGQLQGACTACHTQSAWRPAPRFSHAESDYPLKGKHSSVQCLQCHAKTTDAGSHKDSPLQPRSEVFSRFRPVAHGSCADCHKDPHDGRLGAACMACHVESGWRDVKGAAGERAFHEKTRYPLRGAHLEVACKSCHGGFPGVPSVFKNMRFDTCAACHVDAHLGQLGSPPQACDACHEIQRFLPSRYDPATHRKYPLDGAHALVACSGCHKTDPSLSARASAIRPWIEARHRSDRVSLVQFHPPAPAGRCDTCHADAHRGQFAARVQKSGCGDCHQVQSFRAVRFDHDRESRFALTGAHAQAACLACHTVQAAVVKYKPVDTSCASCHADPHAGQFAQGSGRADCAACHGTADWKKTAFVHKAPFTAFELDGRHALVACSGCHRPANARGLQVTQYRGLPVTCAGCHVDVHRGAFREIALVAARAATQPAPRAAPPQADGDTRCSACHSASGWRQVTFDHSRTGFPLEGRHLSASCTACHRSPDFSTPVPTSCAVCHKDVHTGEFGSRCSGCHDARDWSSRFDVGAHQRTNFPLTGRHAAIPCEECHLEQRDRRFTRATRDCFACHQADYARTAATSIDHARAGFGTDCRSCHFTSRFRGALFPAHRACFQIDAGPHAGISCLRCHTSLSSAAVTGSCSGSDFSCIQCHACPSVQNVHNAVIGFQCSDRKCYECHSFTPGTALRSRQKGAAR